MEYKINQFNITDINYKDLKGLISCFESSIPLSKISICNFGPNLMHIKSTEKKYPKTKEDKKILKSQASLILSSLNSKDKNEESNFCFSMSNDLNKIYLKRFLSQVNLILNNKNKNREKNLDGNNNKDYKQEIKEIINFYNLVSYFTCIKDEYGDEIPITDYYLTISIDKSIKYNKLNLAQFNYEYITHNIISILYNQFDEENVYKNKNNIHIFYMLLYNLPVIELTNYLYCEETKDYFSIFVEEEKLDETTKRYIFINQFKILRNEYSIKFMKDINNSKANTQINDKVIKSEYKFYLLLYENYLMIKQNFFISDEEEKKIFGNIFAILLLSEFEFFNDNLFKDIVNGQLDKINSNKSSINVFVLLRNILISDSRYNFLSNDNQSDRKSTPYFLCKLSYCLGVPEDKIFYLLITEIIYMKEDKSDNSFKENIISTEKSLFKNVIHFINILYLKTIDIILDLYQSYNKKIKLIASNNSKPKKLLNIFLTRSNLIFNIKYEKFLFSNNSFISKTDNIDSNSFIINQNVKEYLYSNYIQEKKNYIYLKNSLSLNFDKDFPKIKENSEYINSIFKESFNFEEILNVYENDICGLLKLINNNDSNNSNNNFNIFDSKNNLNINHFKVQFNKNISRKNKIEIVELFNSIKKCKETFIKVTHTFGVFLYDTNELFNIESSNNPNTNNNESNSINYNYIPIFLKEQMIYKLLEYKSNSNLSSIKSMQEKTNKIINSLLSTKKPIYISCLMELNKFNTLTLFDDMKINIIYVYYSNYYNYILDLNNIKKYFSQNNNNSIPKNIKNKDNFTLFKFLSKKIRITSSDYTTNKNKEINLYTNRYKNSKENSLINYVFVKNKLSNLFGNDQNISLMVYKYNYNLFVKLFCEKVSNSKFNYFVYAINGVKAFVKLTKIYKEKLVLSNVRNLMTDIIVDNYDLLKDSKLNNNKRNEPNLYSLTPINLQLLPKIDNLDELVFDFNREALGKMLPKLRSNLVNLKKIWKDYIYDIIYLINNLSFFSNKECTQLVIEQRMLNFQILLFLFHKNYKFINGYSIEKFGVLVTEFTKTVSNEVLKLILELRKEFDIFLTENNDINYNLNELKKIFENITFEKLIIKKLFKK